MRRTAAISGLVALLLSAGCYSGFSASGADGQDSVGATDGGAEGGESGTAGDTGEDPPIPEGDAAEVGASGLRRLSIAEFERTVADLTGLMPQAVGELLPIDNLTPFDNDYTTQTPSEPLVKGLELLAGDIADAVVADAQLRDALLPCTPTGVDDAACFEQFLATFGRRALRRPLTGEELTRYGVLLDHGVEAGDFNGAVAAALRMFLQHPELVYRVEVGECSGSRFAVEFVSGYFRDLRGGAREVWS